MTQQIITEQEIIDAQIAWGKGIVKIGKAYVRQRDYKAIAKKHIHKFYHYKKGNVLFKPTLASEQQFRTNFKGALSYFIGENKSYPEDSGFAKKPWDCVCWGPTRIKIIGNMAIAMGNYYFRAEKKGEVEKVEYSFVYTKNKRGKLKIILHHSSKPYSPKCK